LTRKGRGAARRLDEARRAKFERLLQAIPREKRPAVIKTLAILRNAMD
jgi:DNA-binding MarR family transcriptional regulator